MPKRYTSTEKWDDFWFRKLNPGMKAYWDYLCCSCDNSGVWEIDLEDASFRVGYDIGTGSVDVLNNGKNRVLLSKCGKFLMVKGFIEFHVGDLLSEKLTNLQKSCIVMLYKHVMAGRFTKEDFGFTGSLPVDYRYKDKKIKGQIDKKIKIQQQKASFDFDAVWSKYPRKLGKDEALAFFKAQVKTEEDYIGIQKALVRFLASDQAKGEMQYIPHGSTWFNKRWRDWLEVESVVVTGKSEAYMELERMANADRAKITSPTY